MTLKIRTLQRSITPHRLVPLRQRYILTRGNKLRLRYVLSGFVLFALSSTFAFHGITEAFFAPVTVEQEIAMSRSYEEDMGVLDAMDVVEIEPASGAEEHHIFVASQITDMVRAQISSGMRHAAKAIKKAEKPPYHEVKISSGGTIAGALQDAGVSGSEAYLAVKAMEADFDPRSVKPGQKIGVHFMPRDAQGNLHLAKVVLKIDAASDVVVSRESLDQGFKSAVVEKELTRISHAKVAEIETSLYGSAMRVGIPARVIADVIRTYSWDVDFQRDIRRGDKISVLYNTYETKDGEFAKYGDVTYAMLSVGGRDIPIYRFEKVNGDADYFEANGQSIRKTLMKTPIDGARLSSGFGMRKHPVLGYNKMHKGTDFAAPTGTPIYAAGDGTIDYAGRKGGYGNYIRVRHNGQLKTAYAHMHKFAKGMVRGKRVKQGDVIGYVGTTGRSTGPHLHYEVLSHDIQVNPKSVNLPMGEQLKGKELARFKAIVGAVDQQYAALSADSVKFAQAK